MPHLMHTSVPGDARHQKIFLAVPTYGSVPPVFLWSLTKASAALQQAGIPYELAILAGNCHVDDSRNALVRRFLESDCDYLMFLDADLGFEGHTLLKVIEHQRDVVAGIYPMKTDDEEYPCRMLPGDIWSDAAGLIEVEGAPTGFMKISRAALLQLDAKADHFLERPDDTALTPIIFERDRKNLTRFSGDYNFCRKWRAAGGKVFIDPELRFEHWGDHPWTGCFGSYLRRRAGLSLRGLQRVKDGETGIEVFQDLFEEWGNNWAASPELLMTLADLARASKGPILETGSGLSTLVMAAANPDVTIHALEHNPDWHRRLQEEVWRQQLFNVQIHLAPLKTYDSFVWYNNDSLPTEDFSLVLCDGPPRRLGQRRGLYQLLDKQLSSAVIVMDDAVDPEQTESLESWSSARGRKVCLMPATRPFAVCPAA